MEEDRQSMLPTAEDTVSWSWPVECLQEVSASRHTVEMPGLDSIRIDREIVLFFLDLARTTGDKAYLAVVSAGARSLVRTWENMIANAPRIPFTADSSSIDELSLTAFALVHAWKETETPAYRYAGLHIIRYIAEMESAASQMVTAAHGGERR